MKKIKVRYFGVLTDITGREEAEVLLGELQLSDFKRDLELKYPELANKDFRFAVNGDFVKEDFKVDANTNEIALLPAFSGG